MFYLFFRGEPTNFRGEATNFHGEATNFRGEATNFRGEATNFHGEFSTSAITDEMARKQNFFGKTRPISLKK